MEASATGAILSELAFVVMLVSGLLIGMGMIGDIPFSKSRAGNAGIGLLVLLAIIIFGAKPLLG